MIATVNFNDRVQLAVSPALESPITKPHCARCGMPNSLRFVSGEWICRRCANAPSTEATQDVASTQLLAALCTLCLIDSEDTAR
jgi:ribosomal protein L37AE/L43A